METEGGKVKVLLICGSDRSGSTLLDLVLGQGEGLFSGGELRHIWDIGLEENQLCGCNQEFTKCEFWRQVFQDAFGNLYNVDAQRIRELWQSVDHGRSIPLLIFSCLRNPGYRKKLIEYTQILGKLYRSISKVSQSEIIIDSSKKPSYGFILRNVPDIDLKIIHLVRDSRAVSYSWQRKKIRPEVHKRKEYMATKGPIQGALSWNLRNLFVDLLAYSSEHCTRVRYEDFMDNPKITLSRALIQLGETIPASLKNLDYPQVNLGVNHTVAGNPMRFGRGITALNSDKEWQEKMVTRRKKLITFLSWPFLLRYGYLSDSSRNLRNSLIIGIGRIWGNLSRKGSDKSL